MAVSVTCTSAIAADGKVRFRFGKREREFANQEAVGDFVRDALSPDVLDAILIAKARQAGSINSIVGKTITADLTLAANVVRIT